MDLLKKLITGIGITATTICAQAQVGSVDHFSGSFIGQYLVVSNNATLLYADVGPFNISYDGVGRYANTSSNLYPTIVSGVSYWTNNAAWTITSGGLLTNANLVNPNAWIDLRVYPDQNGRFDNPNDTLLVALKGDSGAAGAAPGTNTITFSFARVPDGTNAETLQANWFSVAFSGPLQTNAVYTTNLNQTFLTGTRAIRLQKVTSSSIGSGTNVVISALKLCSFH